MQGRSRGQSKETKSSESDPYSYSQDRICADSKELL